MLFIHRFVMKKELFHFPPSILWENIFLGSYTLLGCSKSDIFREICKPKGYYFIYFQKKKNIPGGIIACQFENLIFLLKEIINRQKKKGNFIVFH